MILWWGMTWMRPREKNGTRYLGMSPHGGIAEPPERYYSETGPGCQRASSGFAVRSRGFGSARFTMRQPMIAPERCAFAGRRFRPLLRPPLRCRLPEQAVLGVGSIIDEFALHQDFEGFFCQQPPDATFSGKSTTK